MSDPITEKIHQVALDVLSKVREQHSRGSGDWATKNITFPAGNGVQVEIEIKVKMTSNEPSKGSQPS